MRRIIAGSSKEGRRGRGGSGLPGPQSRIVRSDKHQACLITRARVKPRGLTREVVMLSKVLTLPGRACSNAV